ncbi:hypothetical protein H6G00_01800 [Leptolyngbya sp. FACHB-541]|uniref:hypothetical protein n=1 Tax=Leptolyngbya sp. FACHB-541 TaxID=2692810 RepID=UPI0016891A42|nr:hypothetical protein [Leptolyngbya sp. FACHB-541]MBD1995365.1 hypothetical protein [Leptolyngbya sp. FACHB-541]
MTQEPSNQQYRWLDDLDYAAQLQQIPHLNRTRAQLEERTIRSMTNRLTDARADVEMLELRLKDAQKQYSVDSDQCLFLQRDLNDLRQTVDYWEFHLHKAGCVAYDRNSFQVGDWVKHKSGCWGPVVKVNRKTLTIQNTYDAPGQTGNRIVKLQYRWKFSEISAFKPAAEVAEIDAQYAQYREEIAHAST